MLCFFWKRNLCFPSQIDPHPQLIETSYEEGIIKEPPKINVMIPDDDVCCWICLEPSSQGNKLKSVCACNTVVHDMCLRQWQYTKKGTREEMYCRFCDNMLPVLATKKVNIIFNDAIIGKVILDLSYEWFENSIKKTLNKYDIKFEDVVVEFICKKKEGGILYLPSISLYNQARGQTVLLVRIKNK